MAYSRVQLIAYEVPTGVALPAGKCSIKNMNLTKAVEDDTVFKDAYGQLTDDAKARVGRMLSIIDVAWGSKAPRQSSDTLKVFMAPEFYFRPEKGEDEKARSYDAPDMIAAQQLFRIVFAQQQLKHWLFVLGSMVWNMKGNVAYSSAASGGANEYLARLKRLADKDTVYNTAIVALGGSGVQLYDKVNYSPADVIDQKWRPLKEYCLQSPTQNLLAADNLLCGLEVCYDHQCRQLNTNYNAFKRTWGSDDTAPALDLQLLTACGMPVQKPSVIVGANHLVFRVDGTVAQSMDGRFEHSEIQAVVEGDHTGATLMMDPISTPDEWKQLNTCIDEGFLSGDLKVDVSKAKGYLQPEDVSKRGLDVVEKDLDEVFKQRLAVYPDFSLVHLNN